PAVMTLPAAVPAIFIAAGSNNGRWELGKLHGRLASRMGDCRIWCRRNSEGGETRGFKKILHIASLLSGEYPAIDNLPKIVRLGEINLKNWLTALKTLN